MNQTSVNGRPLVAIRCITYNHEPYIRDALEGFVMQKTDFPFVAIVHDDASTDGTATIIREYAEKYPDIIKPIYETENQYSKKDGSLTHIMNAACEATGAKYIAMCEGDDYWTDPLKLQKQVDFLESHPDYSMCFHGVNVINEGVKPAELNYNKIQSREYSAKELLTKWIVPTCSITIHKECLNYEFNKNYIVGDIVLTANCLKFGKIRGEKEIMAVYRRNQTSWTVKNTSKSEIYDNEFRWIKHYEIMKKKYSTIDGNIFDILISQKMAGITIHDLKSYDKIFFNHFVSYFKEFKLKYIRAILENIINKFIH